MSDDGYIFIVNPCDGYYRRYILENISKYYSRLAVITNEEATWVDKYTNQVFFANSYNENDIIGIIKDFQKNHLVAGVLTYSELITDIVANVAAYFGFRGLSKEAAQGVRNKFVMRQKLRQSSVPIPAFEFVKSFEDASDFVEKYGFPIVLKPTLGGSSEAVIKIGNWEELKTNFPHVYDLSVKKYGESGILIEEYVGGIEVSVETFVFNKKINVVMVTDKEKGDEPYFLETGHIVPSQLPQEVLSSVKKTAVDTIKAIGIENGVTHTEIKYTERGFPKVIEIGGRLGGDFIPQLVEIATGVNLAHILIDIILGKEPEVVITRNNVCAVNFINSEISGILLGYGNLDEVLRKEKVYYSEIQGKIGDRISLPPEDYRTRIGHYILKEQTFPVLREKLDRINKSIALEIL